jgi:thymidine phosphorylase
VGIVLARKPGDCVEPGEPLAHVHARTHEAAAAAVAEVAAAYALASDAPPRVDPLIEVVR